ncbi:hypothetical protein ACUR5C_13955 [Aliikangiella sp. IMCC44653]
MVLKETEVVLVKGNTKNLISVYLFDSKITLPSRFEIVINGQVGKTLVLDSSLSSQTAYQSAIACMSNTVLVGNVEIGNRKDCELCDIDILGKMEFIIVSHSKESEVNYIETKRKGIAKEWNRMTILYDENNYIYLVDQNPKLGKYILEQIKKDI